MASCERHEPSFVRKSLSALPGILLLTGVAVFSWFITPRLIALHPFMKSLNLSDFIVAIILGMVICNTVGVHAVFRDGLRFSTTLTKTGIVVMGCKYSFAGLIKTGSEAIIIISVFLFTSAIILMWLSRRLSMSPSLGACLAAGLSICGVSACVAIAPAVRAKNEDIAYTIAVVLMFGLLALFIFPFIGHWLDLSPNQFGAFAGVGIVNSAQVLAAGFAFSNDAGIVAGVYNIGRVICLPLVVLMLAIMVAAEDAKVHSQLANTSKMRIILDKFPVFVLGFLAVVLLNTFGFMSKEEAKCRQLHELVLPAGLLQHRPHHPPQRHQGRGPFRCAHRLLRGFGQGRPGPAGGPLLPAITERCCREGADGMHARPLRSLPGVFDDRTASSRTKGNF